MVCKIIERHSIDFFTLLVIMPVFKDEANMFHYFHMSPVEVPFREPFIQKAVLF